MPTPTPTPAAPRDAVALLADMRQSIKRQFQQMPQLAERQRPAATRQLLLALELRCKLEEHLLLPALREAAAVPEVTLQADEKDIALLRELAARLPSRATPKARKVVVLSFVEGVAALHFEHIDQRLAVARRRGAIDWLALGADMQAMLARWQSEVQATGDIEDEERDPVGLAPR